MVLNDGQRHKTAYKESAVTDKWGSGRGETCETCLSGTLWEVCLDAARGGEFEARSGVERRGRLNWPRLWCDAARGITFLGVSAESTLGELAPEPPTDPPWPQPPHEPPPRSPPRSPPRWAPRRASRVSCEAEWRIGTPPHPLLVRRSALGAGSSRTLSTTMWKKADRTTRDQWRLSLDWGWGWGWGWGLRGLGR